MSAAEVMKLGGGRLQQQPSAKQHVVDWSAGLPSGAMKLMRPGSISSLDMSLKKGEDHEN